MNNNDTSQISVKYVYFEFDWNWIKDKQIHHRGNEQGGMLIIYDEDGYPVKLFGYELIGHEKKE